MTNLKFNRFYLENHEIPKNLDWEYDEKNDKPAWIHIKNTDFKPRFLSIVLPTNSEVIYQRFTGNFYYPVEIKIDPESEKNFYAKFSQYYDEFTIKNNLPMAQFLLDKIKSFGLQKNIKILDLGAGTGIFSDLAAKNGYTDLTLVDISSEMLNAARKKESLRGAKFIKSNVSGLKLDENYDVIISIMMFDAISESVLPKVIENLQQYLKPRGYFMEIEDKERKIYERFFSKIDSSNFSINNNELTKHFFIGQKK